MTSNKKIKIAKNTLMLYFRQILVLFISLYTVRIILNQLGVEDYGIYGAVGGLVSLGAFLPGSLAQATQRYFSIALGEQDDERLKKIFSVNFVLYAAVAVIIFIVLQTSGVWFVDSYLNLPGGRHDAAKILYQFTVLTFLVNIVASPFMAMIMSYEDMDIFAYMSIFEAIMKLGVAILLQCIMLDKLKLYGFLVFFVSIVTAVFYVLICLYKYKECQFKKIYWDTALLREIVGFTGWTMFGQISTIARSHAVTVLMNQSFSPAVVAARLLSTQVARQVNIFSSNFNTSLYAPIIKSYASNDRQDMFSLIVGGSKITFFLLWVFALPMIVEMDSILGLWLTVVPPNAAFFSQLALIEALVFSVSMPMTAAARAPGKMKAYELTIGTIQIGIFLVSWVIIFAGAPAYSVFIVAIFANVFMFFVRLFIVSRLIEFPVSIFFRRVILPVICVILLTMPPVFVLKNNLPLGIFWTICISLFSVFFSSIIMYYVGVDKELRIKVGNLFFEKFFRNQKI